MGKQYEKDANNYLKNNITLNDDIKGIPVESSENLYEEVHLPINNNKW